MIDESEIGGNSGVDDKDSDIESRVQHGLDTIYLRQLRRIMQVMFLYYFFISVSHFFVLDDAVKLLIMPFSIAATLASGIVFWLTRAQKISARQSHLFFVPTGLLAVVAVYSHIFLSGDHIQITNGVLVMFAIAFATLSPPVFAGIFLICTGLYISALIIVPGPQTVHFAFMYIAASALTILCFVLRYRTLYSSERLLISNRGKAAKLVEASKRIQENIREVRAAADAADKANAAKDVFLANTTHELRTPLTGVLGMMDLLSDTNLDADQRQAVEAAQFSAKTLLVVVNDLLDIAKLDAGKIELVAQAFSPSAVIANVAGLLRGKAEGKSLKLSVSGVKSVTTSLVGDPVRIGQIVLNLLDNAIKFSSDGEIIVAVKVKSIIEGDNSATLHVSVQDSGPGIAPEDQQRLFDRFEQLDATASSHSEGAGLGLSISQGLAVQMGGRLSVQSAVGEGSTFSFEVVLPVAGRTPVDTPEKKATEDTAARHNVVDTAPKSVGNRPLHILLAEDNGVNQLLMKKIAARFSWTLTVVDNGAEAVRAVEGGGLFDLVLMDIRMPVMDGMTAAKAIRELAPEKASTPIIALTANTGADVEAEYRALGMDAIVGKPIDAGALKKSVEQLLDSAEG